MKIEKIYAIEILDSRGNPTVRTTVTLNNGVKGSASVPSGASTGTHEAYELRDHDMTRYAGKGVLRAVKQVNTLIANHLKGASIENLDNLDKKMTELDGTENKKRLGANTILSVSLALARTLAKTQKKPLWKTVHEYYFSQKKPSFPRLMINIINGGKHANWNFDIQEFMIIPKTTIPHEGIRIGAEIFHQLGTILKKNNYSTLVGDEGGYSPALSLHSEVFNHMIDAIMHTGHKKTIDVDLGIDSASSSFFENGSYHLKKENKTLSSKELMEYYIDLKTEYGILSFEDPFAEDDWDGFIHFTQKVGKETLVIGDDLYTTQTERIKRGIAEKATTAVLIKPNQIGTVKETVEAIKLSQQNNMKVIISHRSGETEDPFIADLAVACGADFLKSGSMSRSERLAKYNRLIEIEKLEL